MQLVRKIVELGLAQRKAAGIKVRQPLRRISVNSQFPVLDPQLLQLVQDELNVKAVNWNTGGELSVSLDLDLDSNLIAQGRLRDLIREVQEARKAAGAKLDQHIILTAPLPSDPAQLDQLRLQTLSDKIHPGDKVQVQLV
jgi:hypothetical protein